MSTTLEQTMAAANRRAAQAKYVVMTGFEPYWSTLATYPSEICLGNDDGSHMHMQMNPVEDGFHIDLSLHGFATIEEAQAAVDEWVARHGRVRVDSRFLITTNGNKPTGQSGLELAIVALPIRINKDQSSGLRSGAHPSGYYDPLLTVVE